MKGVEGLFRQPLSADRQMTVYHYERMLFPRGGPTIA